MICKEGGYRRARRSWYIVYPMETDHIYRPSVLAVCISCIALIFGVWVVLQTLVLTIVRNQPGMIAHFFGLLAFIAILCILYPGWALSVRVRLTAADISYRSIFGSKTIPYESVTAIWPHYIYGRGGKTLLVTFQGEGRKTLFTIRGLLSRQSITDLINTVLQHNQAIVVDDSAGILGSSLKP